MVAIGANSTYLSKLGATLKSRGIVSIDVLLSGFGRTNQARSQVNFLDVDGNHVDRSFLTDPVSEESALANHDILEMYMSSAMRLSHKRVKAAHFKIDPVDWSIKRLCEVHSSEAW